MALTNRNKKIRKYKDREKILKSEYLKRTGLKIARGFKNTDEYKKNERNKRKAIERLNLKSPIITKRVNIGFSNMFVIATNEIYHSVLSYGSGADKIAANGFNLMKLTGKKFEVLFSFSDDLKKSIPSLSNFRTKTYQQTTAAMQRLYMTFNNYQRQSRDYIFSSVVSGKYNGNEYLKIDFSL